MSTTLTPPPGQRFLLSGMSWTFYEHLLQELDNRPIRVTFDRGALELMSPSYRHESFAKVLGQMVNVLAEAFQIPVKSARSTTFRRETLERGLEPDECFYITRISEILGKDNLNLETDPPPDLAIEVDITHASVDRIPIYAELGVPELWRFDGRQLMAYHLEETGTYSEPSDQSLFFPSFSLMDFVPFIERSLHVDDAAFSREFREWVRQTLLPSDE